MQFFKEKVHKAYMNTYNSLTGTLTTSKFLEEGVLTPEEFVQAGDLLVYKCPTWTWESGDPAKHVSYLPPDKQFLRTKNVPCLARAKDIENKAPSNNQEVSFEGDEDAWVATHNEGDDLKESIDDEDIPEISEGIAYVSVSAAGGGDSDSDSDIPDMEDFEEERNLEEEDANALDADDNIIRTRTYDISITYDKYYQTPKVWLFGYGENGQPLKTKEIFQDISEDHAKKTVTIDNHPHTGISHAYIHPCKHASVMKKILQNLAQGGGELRVDQYLFVFLKFISAVIPTIEYDYTNFFFEASCSLQSKAQ